MWAETLASHQSRRLRRIVFHVGERLRDPARVVGATHSLIDAASFSRGLAGTALFFSYLDSNDRGNGWDEVAHRHLERASEIYFANGSDGNLSLFNGLAGLGMAAVLISKGKYYDEFLRLIDRKIIAALGARLLALGPFAQRGIRSSEIDLVSGFTGTAIYLTSRAQMKSCRSNVRHALDLIREHFARAFTERQSLPSWYCPPGESDDPDLLKSYPHGFLNVGVAHGMPAMLGVASRWNVAKSSLSSTIEQQASWLRHIRIKLGFWPSVIGLTSSQKLQVSKRYSRPALDCTWCYGGAGISRVLCAAAVSLGDAELYSWSRELFASNVDRLLDREIPETDSICHGKAGLLQALLRHQNEIKDRRVHRAIIRVTSAIVNNFCSGSDFGFPVNERGKTHNRPGLIEGAAGIALVLCAATSDVEPVWDKSLLMSL